MGIRTNIDVSVQFGRDNDLTQVAFDDAMQSLLDTLEREESGTVQLAAGESNFVVPFGDVAQARIVFLRATGPIRVTPGGGTATSAQRDGAGGSYPTGFAGGEGLDLEIDGTAVSVAFDAADQSVTQVINRINAAAALAGITGPGGIPATIARNTGAGQLRIVSPTTGDTSTVEVLGTSDAAVLTALGHTAGVTTGDNATPGSSPLTLMKPMTTSDADPGEGVPVYLLASLVTTAITIDNLDPDNAVEVTFAIAGDLS